MNSVDNMSTTENYMQHTVMPLFSSVSTQLSDIQYSQTSKANVNVLSGMLAGKTIAALRQFSASNDSPITLALNLPTASGSQQRVELTTGSTEPYGEEGLIWVGQSRLFPGQEGLLSIVPDPDLPEEYWVSGRILLDDGRCWLVNSKSGNIVHLVEALTPAKSCFARVPVRVQLPASLAHPPYSLTVPGADEQDMAVIRIMAACPESTLQKLNMGAPALRAKIADWQNVVNKVMRNSGISARIEMLDTLFSLPEPEQNRVQELLRETLASSPDPSRNKKGPDSLWAKVHELRDKTQSDLVLLLAADLSDDILGEAGSIPLPPRADLTEDLSQCTLCFCPDAHGYDVGHVFAHELGHLLGGQHDLETNMRDGLHLDTLPMFDYVCGYQPIDRSFMTTMAYPREGKPWLLYYSAADQSWLNPKTGQREAIGVPFGKPNAADAASFFKGSVRTVASYRGGAKTRLCNVNYSVNPPLGGTLKPDSWGPYPESSRVTIQAVARPGYTFDHWTLDGQNAGSLHPLSFAVSASRKITANFREGSLRHRLTTAVVADAGLTTNIDIYSTDEDPLTKERQSGPAYHPGSEVFIDCRISATDVGKYTFSGWRVNGNKHLVQGYSFETYNKSVVYRLVVRMEEDVKVEILFVKK